jgi:signal transduction histidine kinase
MAAVPTVSPLAIVALELIGTGATAADLDERFAAEDAYLAPGTAGRLLEELAGLGLVRVARPSPDGPHYVSTSLGLQVIGRGLTADAGFRLEELERLRSDLLSTISHELRTPLTAVRTSVGLLVDPASNPSREQTETLLATIDRNADRMQRLVGDILDLTRFRSGAIRLQLRRFAAHEIVESAVSAVRPLAVSADQALEVSLPDAPCPVYGDRRRLEQALLNLLSNAQRYTPDGGRIRVSLAGDDGTVRWTVADNGPGIPEEDQPRLFERFFVGRSDRGGSRQGVGLGLPTALAIAQAHGGTIDVDSRPGAGSTISIVVPAAGPSALDEGDDG